LERIGAILVDTYRIERLIAEGGMGAVYEASHLRIPKKFAIKILKLSLLENPTALLRFRREAEVIATLDHPNIVTLFDYNITEDGVPYTVLEYLEGEHLGDRVSRGRVALVEALRIADAVAHGLSAAHDRGIVHRDLKPENVILCTQGGIKVVDFGIAKLRDGEQLTAFNSILGTITYMAPEQLLAGKVDARADQFAMGAMVYEMLSGEMPFGSDGTVPEIAERVLRKDPPPIAGYPKAVYDVLLRAMAKDPTKRFPDVGAFRDALNETAKSLLAKADATENLRVPAERPTPKTDEGLPEIAGEATSISMAPTALASTTAPTVTPPDQEPPPMASESTVISADPVAAAELPTGETELKSESTRITRGGSNADTDPSRVSVPTAEGPRTAPVSLRDLLAQRLGRRGGIALGVVIGVAAVLLVSLFLR
jgi:serine/threonine-protein kinase